MKEGYVIITYPGKDLPENYRNMVYSKILRSLRQGNDYFKLVDADAYFQSYKPYITSLLHHPLSVVKLAVLVEDQDVVLGLSLVRGNTLDYVHVQKDNRRMGIASNLVPKEIDTISHVTMVGMRIWADKFPQWKFNPFL